MVKKSICILGAGIAGLSAAYKLQQAGKLFSIYEKSKRPGGLLDCFEIGGFRFDQAVHLSFADKPNLKEIFDKTPHYTHKPESKCFDNKLWLKHPIQNNLYPLPTELKVELIESFINRPDKKIANYKDWLDYQYGYKFSEYYPQRYTLKYWGLDACELGVDWIGNRMHRPDLPQVLEGAMTAKTENYYYAKEMRYPKKGGYRAFLNPLLDKLDIRTGLEVIKVNTDTKTIMLSDDSVKQYDYLVSTIPLPEFIDKLESAPTEIKNIAKRLQWTSVHLVSIGFNKPDVVKDLWFYIYDEDIYAARAYSPSVKSPDNCPEKCSSIQFEIYQSNFSKNSITNIEMLENCIYALDKMKLAKLSDIVVTDVRKLEYGNVTFYKGMESDRDSIRTWLDEQNVILAGRFGCWEYYWSHQAMQSGFDVADILMKNLELAR